jgi:prophage tail gpP-like protein
MHDQVQLRINNMRIDSFTSYRIEADIYTADDMFTLDVVNPDIPVNPGMRCELYVNGTLELTGLIDRVAKSYDKSGVKLRVDGRDLCGLLVDSYCTEFFIALGMDLKTLARRLLRKVPFIQSKNIIYQQNIRGNLKKKGPNNSGWVNPYNHAQVGPGSTIFEVLKTYAMSRGAMFFAMPDGTFVFGKPKDGGEPLYSLVCKKKRGDRNNVLEGSFENDYSHRYSDIIVMGQEQGKNSSGDPVFNTYAPVKDPTFPFYKPFVAEDNNDARSPKLHAQMILEKMKYDGFRLHYKVPYHSQNGKNWAINEMCHVEDEVFALAGDYLIYGRTFELTKQGAFTTLRLGLPGMVQ